MTVPAGPETPSTRAPAFAPPGAVPAGDAARRALLHRLALEMIEALPDPSGVGRARFDPVWLLRRGWSVEGLPAGGDGLAAVCDRAAAEAARRPGGVPLVAATSAAPSAAWYVPSDGAALLRVLRAVPAGASLLVAPDDRSFAVLADEAAVAVAGPAGFVRGVTGGVRPARRGFF